MGSSQAGNDFFPRRPPHSSGGAERDERSAAYQAIYYPASAASSPLRCLSQCNLS